MSRRIGVAIGQESVRVVAVRWNRVEWAAETAIADPAEITEAVRNLLSKAPRRRMRRVPVVLAVGPAASQVRVVAGLPPIDDPSVISRMIRQGAHRFFLWKDVPLETSEVQIIEPGRVWAAAFDQPVVTAALAGCRAARYRVSGIVPSLAVLDSALHGERITWIDGSISAEIEHSDGILQAVRRRSVLTSEHRHPPKPREELARIGEDAWRFADAYGAAVRGTALHLIHRPGRTPAGGSATVRWRVRVACGLAVVAALFTMIGPTLTAQYHARAGEAKLAELAELRSAAVIAEARLRDFTNVLSAVAAFDGGRQAVIPVLDGVTAALPSGHALVSFRVDSVGEGVIVAVGPQAMGIVTALEAVPGIASPRIIGPVTRERIGSIELERVTVRFDVIHNAQRPASESKEMDE